MCRCEDHGNSLNPVESNCSCRIGLVELPHAPQVLRGEPALARLAPRNVCSQLHHRALGPAISLDLVVQVLADVPVQIHHYSVDRLGGTLARRADQADNFGECRFIVLGCRECTASVRAPAHRRPCLGFRLALGHASPVADPTSRLPSILVTPSQQSDCCEQQAKAEGRPAADCRRRGSSKSSCFGLRYQLPSSALLDGQDVGADLREC